MSKAQILTYMIWILRITFMTAVILSVGLIVSKYINTRIEISQPQSNIFSYYLLFDNPLLITDKYTGRYYPLRYDIDVLNVMSQENFQREMQTRIGQSALFESGGAEITINRDEPQYSKTYHYNKLAYERLKPLAQLAVPRLTAVTHTYSTYLVNLEEQGRSTPAILTIDVYLPK